MKKLLPVLLALLILAGGSLQATMQRVNLRIFTPEYGVWNASSTTMAGAGQSSSVVGYLVLEGGNGSSKTCSSSGCKIYWRVGSPITFGNGSTHVKIGIQDVSTTNGLEDGTYDVNADLVGGVNTISANTYNKATMSTGTKTMAHGDLIAVIVEMTARGGTDSVVVSRYNQAGITPTLTIPYGTVDTGTLAKNASMIFAFIEFDDGTGGWIDGAPQPVQGTASVNFNQTSTPDEYLAAFTPQGKIEIDGMGTSLSDIDSGDEFEFKLYSDPLGTPSALVTVTVDSDITNNATTAAASYAAVAVTPTTLTGATEYGVSAHPTTNNSVTYGYIDLGVTNQVIKKMLPFGSSIKVATRTDNTGAFSVLQTYYIPGLYLRISQIDDGTGTTTSGHIIGSLDSLLRVAAPSWLPRKGPKTWIRVGTAH